MPYKNDELSSYNVCLFHKTERAILVGNTGERDKAFWLPLSQVDVECTYRGKEAETVEGKKTGHQVAIISVAVPQWLAEERGLV